MIQRLLMGLVRAYRLFLSPWLGSSCRFEPTCSVYSLGALEAHGSLAGSYLTVARLGRCHPWCAGGLVGYQVECGDHARLAHVGDVRMRAQRFEPLGQMCRQFTVALQHRLLGEDRQ